MREPKQTDRVASEGVHPCEPARVPDRVASEGVHPCEPARVPDRVASEGVRPCEPARVLPALDGLRGLAIFLVMLFHFSWTFAETPLLTRAVKYTLWAGWVGVDLFFVLSGFLITRGLVAPSPLDTRARIRNFWIRRSLRIFPLYFITLVVGSIACAVSKERLPELSYWLYVQNYSLAFDPDPERWTSHLWSLAVEEQFYFVWPLAVLFAARRHIQRLIPIIVGLCLLAAVLRIGVVFGARDIDPLTRVKLAYRALPTRMDPLLMGAALAIFEAVPSRLSRLWQASRAWIMVASAALVLVLAIWTRGFGFYDRRIVVLGYGTIALLFAGMVSLASDGGTEHRVLTWRPLRELGRVSYGMYVFHWPIVALAIPFLKSIQDWTSPARALAFGIGATSTCVLVTYALAALSFRYVEMPFLRLKTRFGDR
jgi:peptidoglycan/LPS O-acetylase OafA/YrhL